MFGSKQRKKSLFGSSVQSASPGAARSGALFGAPGKGATQPEQPEKKRSILPYALAAVEDTLSRQMGYQPQGVARLNAAQAQQQEMAARSAAEQRKRAMELADWRWKEQWKRDNPMPANNDTVADYEFIRERLGPEAAETYLRNRADPPQYRQGPDGRFYRIETAQPPARPVGGLKPMGGTGGNVGGGF